MKKHKNIVGTPWIQVCARLRVTRYVYLYIYTSKRK